MKLKSVSLGALVFLVLPTAHCLGQYRVSSTEVRVQAPPPAPQTAPVAANDTAASPNLSVTGGKEGNEDRM